MDEDILSIMATQHINSAYKVWVEMKREKGKENVIAYKNIGRRVLLLQKRGYLEEINVDPLHGRKDYRLTIKGIKELIPYILDKSKDSPFRDIAKIVEYLEKNRYHQHEKQDIGSKIYMRTSIDIISLIEYLGRALNIWLSFDIRPMEADEKNLYHPLNDYMKLQNTYQRLLRTDEMRAKQRALKQKGLIKDRPSLDKPSFPDESEEIVKFSKGVETMPGRKKKS